ncbi:uncharacterized protein LOC131537607 [Onychostoma macrolepis]|uniref:Uncharacterized protein n=1 Tax=Onychostoma macrolepis TaxID=369639 RepID=A0A7J6D7J9_9TELE|nr:uncharacterized protein LOC131537607 [Onychostoma macrolepis]KAF4115256.1 hypothetical protein G5714_002745 [Onychostoma macrolepis]
MKLSAAERQRQYRARRDADPVRKAENLRKDRERRDKRKTAGQTNKVADLGEREKRYKRRYWRETQQRCRENRQRLVEMTPPQSPEPDQEPQISRQRQSGRRKIKRENSKLYREIEKLKILLKKKTTAVRKYQKRLQRLTCVSESPRSKTRKQLRRHKVPAEIQKTLFFS